MKTIIPTAWALLFVTALCLSRYEVVSIPMISFSVISLYGMAFYALATDPYLSPLERGCCLAAVLFGSIFGLAISGIYASSRMKKRFRIDFRTERMHAAEPCPETPTEENRL